MSNANINTNMLSWARERSGIAVFEFAHKCQITIERLNEWETGTHALTFKQAQRFAEKAHIPFGYLFLQQPPHDELPIPDLRTVDSTGANAPSAELIDIIKLMQQRQDWYKEYLNSHLNEPCPVVGRFSVTSSINNIVEDMRTTLDLPPHPNRGKWDEYYRDLVGRIESAGIMVMRQGNLGHYTRPLDVKEFRGFAIADELAPIIFINHADCLGARLFTLIHETCHIWIGQSGISDSNTNTHRAEEILCNAVAAEFLVPEEEFTSLWQNDLTDWRENLINLESHFHVSTWVLARRALTLNFISQQDYQSYIAAQQTIFESRQTKGGPTYYQTKKAQISGQFCLAVVTEALNGQLLFREAGQLLGGIKPGKIATFARELGVCRT